MPFDRAPSEPALTPDARGLRVALFSGNYNYVKDGANKALNRWVGYLLDHGAEVIVFSPTSKTPAFEPVGELVSVPSIAMPRRDEYRLAFGLTSAVRRRLEAFKPNLVHVSAPDMLGHGALSWARRHNVPSLASVHTRFETYFRYYGLGFIEPLIRAGLRRFYGRADHVVAPSPSMIDALQAQRMGKRHGLWTRGVELDAFTPAHRSEAFRAAHGFAPDDVVIGFVGRLVLEKGLSCFAKVARAVAAQRSNVKFLVVGDGPERAWFKRQLPDGVFTGFLSGQDLAHAYASADMFLFPSTTETFGNVTLEAMASGAPTVCADATGSRSLVADGETGFLVSPTDYDAYEDRLIRLVNDPALRARLGVAARAHALRYDWDAVLGRLLDQALATAGLRAAAAVVS
ncbi:MAG: glycosyltransferase family 4 protein [Maricaulaceae bacterium]